MTEESTAPGPGTKKPPSNLAFRLLTAAVAVPLILALIFKAPAWGLLLLVVPAVLLGCFELFSMTHHDDPLGRMLGTVIGGLVCGSLYFLGSDPRIVVTLLLAVPVAGPLLTLIRIGDVKTAALRAASLGFGPLYVAVPLTLVVMLRRDHPDSGPAYVLFVLIFSWLADTGGYFAGRFLGKHKLYEAVSPKKTVEGAIGGLAAAVLGGFIVRALCLPEMPAVHLVVLALVAAAAGQAGDLAESLLKRSVGVKDSGNVLPGHGGILDRVDATLLTAVVVYLYALWIA